MAVNQNINISRYTCVEVSLLFVHLQNIHQEFLKLTFQTLALHQSEKKALICQRVNIQNFMRSLQLPIYIINPPPLPNNAASQFLQKPTTFYQFKTLSLKSFKTLYFYLTEQVLQDFFLIRVNYFLDRK